MKEPDVCYVCLRVPFDEILDHTKKIFPNEDEAKCAALWVRERIKEVYSKDQTKLSGRSGSSILAALFYLYSDTLTQREVARALGINAGSLRNAVKLIAPILSLPFDFGQRRAVEKKAREMSERERRILDIMMDGRLRRWTEIHVEVKMPVDFSLKRLVEKGLLSREMVWSHNRQYSGYKLTKLEETV